MSQYTLSARIVSGSLQLTEAAKKDLRAAMSKWRDCPVTITVKRLHATRSLDQNRYYFFGIGLLAEQLGYTPNEMHELVKMLHLDKDDAASGRNGKLFEGYVVGGSTARLNKLEFSAYIERFRVWAASEFNCVIPDPQQYEGSVA